MTYAYDPENIFAKILRKEIPNATVMETDHTLAFNDINPGAPTHVLVIPKGPYVCYDHFALEASDAEIVDFTRVVGLVCEAQGVQPSGGAGGYRLITNAGPDGVQDVPHMHVHVIGGRGLGRMLAKAAE